MAVLVTQVEIDGTADEVWRVLTDFSRYPEWNSFVNSIVGEAREGARLDVRLTPPGGRGMRFTPKVLAAVPGRELRWLGRMSFLGVPLLLGEHYFVLEEEAGDRRVRLVHGEHFRGLLAPLMPRLAGESTRLGFEAMNRELKARVEGARSASPSVGSGASGASAASATAVA
jgi:hypothetical protein